MLAFLRQFDNTVRMGIGARQSLRDHAMIFDRCLSIGWSLGAILRLRRKRRGRRTALLFEPGAVHSVPRVS